MSESNTFYFNGKAALPIEQFINLVGGTGADGLNKSLVRLYSSVSWLYRGVSLLENGVAAMPFELRRGDNVIYEYDPNSSKQSIPPRGLEYVADIPRLSAQIEGASVLRGKAYLYRIANRARTIELRWLIPDTITPRYDAMGNVSGFVREYRGQEQPLEVDDVLWFWPDDKFVENGPARNYPGMAALASAGVLDSQDNFLRNYFDRGLISAGFLRYEQQVSPDEQARIKEWWNRLTSGLKSAFNNLIVRGDFSYEQIGNGLKDLENTGLTTEQRESIATALGIPQSKMTQPPGGLGDTKTPDDMIFITDTIIPACAWIANTWNKRHFNKIGYSLIYTPQKLPIMQEDEVRRSQALVNYINSGYARKEAESILGIYIPDKIRDEVAQDQMVLGNATQGAEKTLLNGVQVESALSIISTLGEGIITRDNAIKMYDAFLGINPDVARQLIPETVTTTIQTNTNDVAVRQYIEDSNKSISYAALIDWRDERDQFFRWLENRKGNHIELDDFTAKHLSLADKRELYFQWQNDHEINGYLALYADFVHEEN